MTFRERIVSVLRRVLLGRAWSESAQELEDIRKGKILDLIPKGKQPTLNTQNYNKTNDPKVAPPLAGGRQSVPTNWNPLGLSGYHFVVRREYQDLDLSNINIGDYEATQLLEVLADLSPDVSRAVWNVLRVAGSQLTFQVVDKNDEDDLQGQAIVDEVVGRLNITAGGISNLIVQLIMTAYLQGAICMDIAPTAKLDDVEDFFPVNPITIYFMRDENQFPIPYQRQPLFWGSIIAPFRRMNTQLFLYTPIDPYVDDVYGRPPAAPVLQVVFFQTQVLRDLQRVIHSQGWPKIDISVLTDIIMQHMPADIKIDPQQQQDWINARLNEITSAYNNMNPEDAYIHPDYVEVSSDAAKAGESLFNVEGLLRVIRMQLISALKQLPVLMGEHLGSTETYSVIELAIFTQSIEVFRQPVGHMLSRALEVALQLRGHVAVVRPKWAPIQVQSRMAIALADAQEAANQVYYRDQGWITQDTAAIKLTGSNAVSEVPPIYTMVPPMPMPPAPQQPKPNNGPLPAHVANANSQTP